MGNLTEDLAGSLSHEQIKQLLSSALDLVRPYHLAIGTRIRRLSRSQVEVLIPAKPHNLNSQGSIEEGILLSLGIQMCRLLLARWEWVVTPELEQAELVKLASFPHEGDLIGRLEWGQVAREALRAEVVDQVQTQNTWTVHFFDREDRRVADLVLVWKIRGSQSLTGESLDAGHSHRAR